MQTQQAVSESTIRSVVAPLAGSDNPSAPRTARVNDNAPRSGAFAADAPETAKGTVAKSIPPAQPTESPRHGRPAADRPGSGFAPSQALKSTVGFLAQLISQDGLADIAANEESGAGAAAGRPAQIDPLAAQGRHYQRVEAYRTAQSLKTPFAANATGQTDGAERSTAPGGSVVQIDI